jgi:FKBP-type peptidyl-prolyl cis-trans isomerase
MINKFEAIGIFLCVGVMAFTLFLMRMDSTKTMLSTIEKDSQVASVVTAADRDKANKDLTKTLESSMDINGKLGQVVSDDVVVGTGAEVKTGDTVSVNYVGTLQNGTEFDNSYKRGEAFEFTVGEGRVIKGWDQGLLGMKVGGQRILIIPAEFAYGASQVGPIPANSTLVFAVELVSIK